MSGRYRQGYAIALGGLVAFALGLGASLADTAVIASPEALAKALDTARPGDVLTLAPGDYGRLMLDRAYGSAAAPLTIRSADPDDPARFYRADIKGAEGVTLEGMVFDYTFTNGDNPYKDRPFQLHGSQDVTLRRMVFDGDLVRGQGGGSDGYGAAFGLSIRDARGVTIEDSVFQGWYRGLVASQSGRIVLRGNRFHSIRSDGADFAEVTEVLIEGNHFHDFARSPDSGDHPDMIQFWTNQTDTPSRDIVIRDNVFNSGHGLWTQTIFMRNEEVDTGRRGREMFYRDIEISGNVIINAHLHGITVGETDGLVIRNNTLVRNQLSQGSNGTDGLWTPTIRVKPASDNVSIIHNIVAGIEGPDKRPDWQVEGNLLIQDAKPSGNTYYDKVFVAALTGDPGNLAPFNYLPDGPAGRGDLGAPRLRVLAGSEANQPMALIRIEPDARYINRFTFDASLSRTASGTRPLWQFSDGTTASGATVTHTFPGPGIHEVRLNVGPGEVGEMTARVVVPGTEVLRLDPSTGGLMGIAGGMAQRIEGVALEALPEGGLALPLGQGRPPMKLRPVDTAGLYGAHDMALDLRFRTARTKSPAGEILRIHQSFTLSLTATGGLQFSLLTEGLAKSVTIQTAPLRLHDGRWHDISLRYDAGTGTMAILVDGVERSRGRANGPMRPGSSHGLSFGNPSGKKTADGFIGALDLRVNLASLAPT